MKPPAIVAAIAALLSCRSGDEKAAKVAPVPPVAPPATVESGEDAPTAPAPPAPPYPPEVRSVRLRRSISVRLEPAEAAKRIGTVAQDTRVRVRGAKAGPGCETRWIEIEPRGWVCETYLEPSDRAPTGAELPKLERGELVPGQYGKLSKKAVILTYKEGRVVGQRPLDGSATVRRYAEEDIRGQRYWRIAPDEYVPAKAIEPHEPSAWHGTRLGDDTGLSLPLGFAVPENNRIQGVPVYTAPDAATQARTIGFRTRVALLETATGEDGAPTAYRIGEGQWVRAGDLRVARATEPPPTTEPGERWIDVDLDSQVLIAYEGETPVYVTLVSSGAKKTPTETGIFRIWVKFAETDMSGQMGDEPAYSVATVPWTQYYAKDLALHTTYWHDKLGTPRSHGCVNLSPVDARFLYFWSTPQVPVGWSMAHGVVERPGSMVRVRSAADPAPEWKGYATRVYEARRPR